MKKLIRHLFSRWSRNQKKVTPLNSAVQLTLNTNISELDQLEALAAESNLDKKGLFNNALTLWNFVVQEKKAGRHISSLDEEAGTLTKVNIPALNHLGPSQ